MSFAELRQSVLQANAISTDYFGEDVEVQPPGGAVRIVQCKVTHSAATTSKGPGMGDDGALDEFERIKILVSRDPGFAKSLPEKPAVGTNLRRSVTRDNDRRPYAFAGEVEFEGDQHAVYFFQRPRRVAHGRR